MNKILWKDTSSKPSFSSLDKDIETDILIVGGGITGILTAHYLQKAGYKVILVEKNKIGESTTLKSTAVVTAQHDTLYQDRIKKIGLKKTKLFLDASLNAISLYENLSKEYNFDFETIPTYMYTCTDPSKLEYEHTILQTLNFETKIVPSINLPFEVKNAIMYPNQAQINVIKLINELSKDLTIYEDTEVKKVTSKYAYTDKYKIKANKIILTIHFPFIDHLGLYFAKMYQTKSYVLAIKTKDSINGSYISDHPGGLYFRKYKDYLLIGGNDTITGNKTPGFKNLKQFVKRKYPNSKIEYSWVNQDCMTLDNLPYIGSYSNFVKNIYIAAGFNLWGMTNAMIASQVFLSLVNNKETEYTKLFNPNRVVINKQLFTNLSRYMKNLLTISPNRCSHLGSSLKWNEEEGIWECPCHGSKFNVNKEPLNPLTTSKLKEI